MLHHKLIVGDCLKIIGNESHAAGFDCIMADPPDNIGLGYDTYADVMPVFAYQQFLRNCVYKFTSNAPIVWISFNPIYTAWMGHVAHEMLLINRDWELKPCVQTFTFGQYNKADLTTCHRPLWRFKRKDAPLYPDNILEESWRQAHGDKRAAPGGRVPGDVFNFPRVTGNSKQRRKWHPTQLNEKVVERAVLLSTQPGQTVLDPFGGTGTTLRVCERAQRQCTLIELSENYSKHIWSEWMNSHKPDDPNHYLCMIS